MDKTFLSEWLSESYWAMQSRIAVCCVRRAPAYFRSSVMCWVSCACMRKKFSILLDFFSWADTNLASLGAFFCRGCSRPRTGTCLCLACSFVSLSFTEESCKKSRFCSLRWRCFCSLWSSVTLSSVQLQGCFGVPHVLCSVVNSSIFVSNLPST